MVWVVASKHEGKIVMWGNSMDGDAFVPAFSEIAADLINDLKGYVNGYKPVNLAFAMLQVGLPKVIEVPKEVISGTRVKLLGGGGNIYGEPLNHVESYEQAFINGLDIN